MFSLRSQTKLLYNAVQTPYCKERVQNLKVILTRKVINEKNWSQFTHYYVTEVYSQILQLFHGEDTYFVTNYVVLNM